MALAILITSIPKSTVVLSGPFARVVQVKLMHIIYCLRCPTSGAVRYIGQTTDIDDRFKRHIKCATAGKYYSARWIAKLIREGLRPVIVQLMYVPECFKWQTMERFMIASARHFDMRLTNSTAGGDGVQIMNEEVRDKMRAASYRNYHNNPDNIKKMSDAARPWINSDENKKRIRAHNQEPELKERWLKALRDGNATEQARKNKREAQQRLATDPKMIAARSAGAKNRYAKPEEVAKQAALISALWSNPEWKAKTSVAIRASYTPEVREKMSAASRQSWASGKRKQMSAESRAKHIAAIRRWHEGRWAEKLRRTMELET